MEGPSIEVAGARVEVGPSIVLAVGERLIAAAALEEAPAWAYPPRGTLDLVARLLSGEGMPRGADPLEAARALATVYGGVILVYMVEGLPVPIARLPPVIGSLDLGDPGGCRPRVASDAELLEWWARSAAGNRLEGEGCTHSPEGIPWRAPGSLGIAPVGYRSRGLIH